MKNMFFFIRNMIFQTKTYYDIEQVSIKNHVLIIYPLLYIIINLIKLYKKLTKKNIIDI